ncbi:hypothetical protein [Candidatus Odyssella acanthamoebae]|nr:hypothetical protein [Candidatus Paracaedibacter acanthamoebae]
MQIRKEIAIMVIADACANFSSNGVCLLPLMQKNTPEKITENSPINPNGF